jgi:hypothetical protein
MQLLIAGAVATLIATVALKFVDIWFEGRGSRMRRGIAADLELLERVDASSVPDGRPAVELKRRIESGLLAFSMTTLPPSVMDEVDKKARRIFAQTSAVAAGLFIGYLLALVGRDSKPSFMEGLDTDWGPLLAVIGSLLGYGTSMVWWRAARSLATTIVRREYAVTVINEVASAPSEDATPAMRNLPEG